jgi:hypothetical protein
MHQCSECFSVDQTAKKAARAAKKKQAPVILPLILEYLSQPVAVAPHVAPLLSPPAPLFASEQQFASVDIAVAPKTPTSVAGELNSKTPKSAAVKTPNIPNSAAVLSVGNPNSPKSAAVKTPKTPNSAAVLSVGNPNSLNSDAVKIPKPLGYVQKRLHDEFDADSSSDDSHHRARHKLPLPIPSRADLAALKQKLQEKMDALQQKRQKLDIKSPSPSASDGTTSSDDGAADEDVKTSKDRLPRITAEERSCVCDWIAKDRKDGKMNNGRWIRNGGAKGATMTATSSEVKTSGAYEALAV